MSAAGDIDDGDGSNKTDSMDKVDADRPSVTLSEQTRSCQPSRTT